MAISTNVPIVLISGANQGLGFAIAKRLASEHGYHTIIGSRNTKAGEEAAASITSQGFSASNVQLDITSDGSISAAVGQISDTYGRLDVLINNAGIMLDIEKDTLSTRELFTRTFSTNTIGAACLTEACLPLLRKSQLPRVIFVSSIMGSVSIATDKTTIFYPQDYRAYDSSKAALNMLALNFDRELEDVGALVNCVCPGLVSSNLSAFTKQYGAPPEEGAQRIVELATAEKGSATGTFSDKNGPIAW